MLLYLYDLVWQINPLHINKKSMYCTVIASTNYFYIFFDKAFVYIQYLHKLTVILSSHTESR